MNTKMPSGIRKNRTQNTAEYNSEYSKIEF